MTLTCPQKTLQFSNSIKKKTMKQLFKERDVSYAGAL